MEFGWRKNYGALELRGLFLSLSDGGDRCLQPPVS